MLKVRALLNEKVEPHKGSPQELSLNEQSLGFYLVQNLLMESQVRKYLTFRISPTASLENYSVINSFTGALLAAFV